MASGRMNNQRGRYCIHSLIRKPSERLAITRVNRPRIVVRNRFGIYSWNAIQVRDVLEGHWKSLRLDTQAPGGRFPTKGWIRPDKTNYRWGGGGGGKH